MLPFQHRYTENRTMENCNFCLFAEKENGNDKLPMFAAYENKKTEVCFPWLANNKR